MKNAGRGTSCTTRRIDYNKKAEKKEHPGGFTEGVTLAELELSFEQDPSASGGTRSFSNLEVAWTSGGEESTPRKPATSPITGRKKPEVVAPPTSLVSRRTSERRSTPAPRSQRLSAAAARAGALWPLVVSPFS